MAGVRSRSRPPSPVRLNWRVHMHFPEAVHLGQSETSQLVSVQLLDRKISRWLILQSCSDAQLMLLMMQLPSGQLVHHLQGGTSCCGGATERGGAWVRNGYQIKLPILPQVSC